MSVRGAVARGGRGGGEGRGGRGRGAGGGGGGRGRGGGAPRGRGGGPTANITIPPKDANLPPPLFPAFEFTAPAPFSNTEVLLVDAQILFTKRFQQSPYYYDIPNRELGALTSFDGADLNPKLHAAIEKNGACQSLPPDLMLPELRKKLGRIQRNTTKAWQKDWAKRLEAANAADRDEGRRALGDGDDMEVDVDGELMVQNGNEENILSSDEGEDGDEKKKDADDSDDDGGEEDEDDIPEDEVEFEARDDDDDGVDDDDDGGGGDD